ncbi:MAG: toll/interleukin-1 receptor domain-containing protein [Planctomycetes bacterium]|nr:toll/interleukin-1 receptor domain-containing protein [Planctomycetota bacterium]
MKAFITYDELKSIATKYDAQKILKEARVSTGKTVFLSHSSKDNDILPGVIRILEGHGGKVYVDVRDHELNKSDFTATAARLREAVRNCSKFVLLVTPRTNNSKWIPWELGLGDGAKRDQNVALFPSAEQSHEKSWSEQEYLGLYQRIIWGNFEGKEEPEWMVLNHVSNIGNKLARWLR